MKKTISTILVCVLLVGSLLTLASCEVAGFVFGTYSRTDDAFVAEITTTYEFSLTEVTKTVVTKIGNTTTTSDPEVMKYKVGKNDEGEKVIFSTRYGQDVVALKKADGTVIPFASLSDGYRNVIKIILDIATRMCILNPYLQGEALEKTPGVVIIDEIDLSLHPTWQKRIVRILKSLFPKVQFICATHSPFIIQSLQQDELITLDREEKPLAEEYADVSIEDIAEDIMGVQIPQYSDRKIKMYEAAREFFDALQQGRSKEDIEALREKMARLEAEYSDNPAYLAWMEQKFTAKELEVTSQ